MTLDSPDPIRPVPPRRAHSRGRAPAVRPPAPASGPGSVGAGLARTVREHAIAWRASGGLSTLVLLVLVGGGCIAVIYLTLLSQPASTP